MRFQQNMAVRRAKHGTAGSRLCGRAGQGGWQRTGGCASPGDRAYTVPTVEATTIVGWCRLAWRARRGGTVVGEHATRGAVAAAVERKAGGRRGREGGVGAVVEPVAERMRDFF
jgi:hypothetical protein